MGHIQLPTKLRFMSGSEYGIVSRVFGDTLPWIPSLLCM